MKAAIIGCGAISNVHVDSLVRLGIEITALCDVEISKAESMRQKFNLSCSVYSDYKEMIKVAKPDVVHLCLPHYLHTPIAVYALQNNINVLCEKPSCISMEEIELLKNAEQNSDGKLGICLQNRYLASSAAAKQFVKDKSRKNAIGTVLWNRGAAYYQSAEWRGKKLTEGGGVMINQAIHTLDLMLWLCGKPISVTANVNNFHLNGVIDVEDTAQVYVETEGGTVMLFATTASSDDFPVDINLSTENGKVRLYDGECFINGERVSEKESGNVPKAYWGVGHYTLIKDFYRCLDENKRFSVNIDDFSYTLKTLFAIYKSGGKKIIL